MGLIVRDGSQASRTKLLNLISEVRSIRAPHELFRKADQGIRSATALVNKAERQRSLAYVLQGLASKSRKIIQDHLKQLLIQHQEALQHFASNPVQQPLFERVLDAAEGGSLTVEQLQDFHANVCMANRLDNAVCPMNTAWVDTMKSEMDALLSTISESLQSTHPNTSLDAAGRFSTSVDEEKDDQTSSRYTNNETGKQSSNLKSERTVRIKKRGKAAAKATESNDSSTSQSEAESSKSTSKPNRKQKHKQKGKQKQEIQHERKDSTPESQESLALVADDCTCRCSKRRRLE